MIQVKIIETLERVIDVDVETYEEAVEFVEEEHAKGNIVLDADDFTGYEIVPADE